MFRYFILAGCACASICYYSKYKQKSDINRDISMEIVKGLEGDKFDGEQLEQFLTGIDMPDDIKSEVRAQITLSTDHKCARLDDEDDLEGY